MFFGTLAVYKIDFSGREIISERMIASFGKDAKPPPRDRISMPTSSAANNYKAFKAKWEAVRQPDRAPVRRPLRIKKKPRRESYAGLAAAVILMSLGGIGIAAYELLAPSAPAVVQAVPDPKRFDSAMMVVPTSNGRCDQIQFNNRTGGSSFAGTKNCSDIEQQAAAEEAAAKSRQRPNSAMQGVQAYFGR